MDSYDEQDDYFLLVPNIFSDHNNKTSELRQSKASH